MKKQLLTICAIFALFTMLTLTAKAQSYNNAIGGRFGTANETVRFKADIKDNATPLQMAVRKKWMTGE